MFELTQLKRKKALVDCDGPLTEGFLERACQFIAEETGNAIQPRIEDIDQWDLMASLGVPDDAAKRVWQRLEDPGIALNFAPHPGAVQFMDELQAAFDVTIVTSPFGGPHWVADREAWLQHWFGIKPERVLSRVDKALEIGDFFIDDKLSHLQAWQPLHPDGIAILWRTYSNRRDAWPHEVTTYDQLLTKLRS